MLENLNSKPYFSKFSPDFIPYQRQVIDFLDDWDYSTGTPELLLSGSYGSAKSILMAHLAIRHCIEWPKARVCLARKALPDLKDTIFKEILEHLEEDFVEGVHYTANPSTARIEFYNGSEIISKTHADKKYKKGRSLKLSMLIFEELTENNEDDMAAFTTLKARLRRIKNVKENILIAATNPDSPSHWVHKYFIDKPAPTKKVFYSITTDNPFLDPIYIEQLKKDLDPKEAQRYIYGQWIEIDRERVYHSYNSEKQFLRNIDYEINPKYPIKISFDFNIGEGKPMSSCASQFINDNFHTFDEVVVPGMRTQDVLDEWNDKGYFSGKYEIIIHGDASGSHSDTRSRLSDYEIIRKYLSNIPGLRFKMEVPLSNPPIRTRHNRVNAYCLNDLGQTRLWIYKKAKTVDAALRLTQLKKGADIIEDDSKPEQHIGTALGYMITYEASRTRTMITARGK